MKILFRLTLTLFLSLNVQVGQSLPVEMTTAEVRQICLNGSQSL